MIEVISPGPLTLVQDLGRPGWAALGVGSSGAFDRASLRLANRLVGNRESATCLETLGGGLEIHFRVACVVAVTGAEGSVMVRGGVGVSQPGQPHRPRGESRNSPLYVNEGEVLTIGPPTAGLRSYVAVRRGIAVPHVLGSASRDTLGGIGPEPVLAGDLLDLGDDGTHDPLVDHVAVRARSGPLRVMLGPREDWFTGDAISALTTTHWSVATQIDRVGIRLLGGRLSRAEHSRELPSEPVFSCAIQVPPDGSPVILGADHPTTGGYPVIAVVIDADLDRLAQLRPGDVIDMRAVEV